MSIKKILFAPMALLAASAAYISGFTNAAIADTSTTLRVTDDSPDADLMRDADAAWNLSDMTGLNMGAESAAAKTDGAEGLNTYADGNGAQPMSLLGRTTASLTDLARRAFAVLTVVREDDFGMPQSRLAYAT